MDLKRWRGLPLRDQIGHITSEIARARGWEERGDAVSRDQALERALELLDLTVDCYRSTRRRELARLREMVSHCLVRSEYFAVTLLDLERFGLRSIGAQ